MSPINLFYVNSKQLILFLDFYYLKKILKNEESYEPISAESIFFQPIKKIENSLTVFWSKMNSIFL